MALLFGVIHNTVIFYMNHLRETPIKDLLVQTYPEAIDLVHGLGPVHRWTGTEYLTRRTFMVPSPIVAYNVFMNSVDIMDQRRSSTKTQSREKHMYMSRYMLILDMACHNSYALYRWYHDERDKDNKNPTSIDEFTEFKRLIAEYLCEPLKSKRHCDAVDNEIDGNRIGLQDENCNPPGFPILTPQKILKCISYFRSNHR